MPSYLDGGYLAGDDTTDYDAVIATNRAALTPVANSAWARLPRTDLINPKAPAPDPVMTTTAPEPLSPWVPTLDRFKGSLGVGPERPNFGGGGIGAGGIEVIPAWGVGGLGALFIGRRLSPKARWTAAAVAAYLGATRGAMTGSSGSVLGNVVHSGAAAAALGLLASSFLGKRKKA